MELSNSRIFRDSQRSSQRSKESSSTSDVDPKERIKDCCRKFVAFMFTQVGVGGLIVGYTVVGAFTFIKVEQRIEDPEYERVTSARLLCGAQLWEVAKSENIFNETISKERTNYHLKQFQEVVVDSIQRGYTGRTMVDVWSFPAALMFSLSIITMIGYGNMVPKTPWGKGVTVIYAVFGIPLYVLYFLNMGEVLAGCFKWVYTWLHECTTEHNEDDPPRRIIVPSSACLWVIGGYVLTGAIMFAEWEKWNYLDSTYFCVTSLCKIGFGDLVPGANIFHDYVTGSQTKLVINFVYMLVGLGLVAMCYNLMSEEIRVKVEELREDVGQCFEDTQVRFSTCLYRCGLKKY